MLPKLEFEFALNELASTLANHVSADDGQWTVKGFIDVFKNVYTISSDTKIISKILEIHLFPKILAFAERYGFAVVLAEHQNYYPDISFVCKDNKSLKFAVDFKTTYRNPKNHGYAMALLLARMANILRIGRARKYSVSLCLLFGTFLLWNSL